MSHITRTDLSPDSHPEVSTNGVHEAMALCVLTASLRKPNGQDRLQPVLQLAGDTSENRVAVVHLAVALNNIQR